MRRARHLAAACALGVVAYAAPAVAAFEWTHATPRSWIIGLEEAGWPLSIAPARFSQGC